MADRRSVRKEQLRREREQREAQTKAAQRRRRLFGYGAGALLVLFVAAALIGFLARDGGGESVKAGSVLPAGGTVPKRKVTNLAKAVKAAGCKLRSVKGGGVGDHSTDLSEKINYDTNPPTHGRHYVTPALDGAYERAPDVKKLVHELEHGRIVIWFQNSLPAPDRAGLKALFDEDDYQMVLTPDDTGMSYAVAATAWNRDPRPEGTGRLLGCAKFNPRVYDAIRAFRDKNRGKGPEAVQ